MLRKDEKGQALYIAAMSMLVLMGFLGLGIDMGVLRYERRLQQSAADAAAIAGASNLAYGGNAAAVAGAQKASAQNGFADNTGGTLSCSGATAAIGTICVQVNNPPSIGPHSAGANASSYVEVLVSTVQSTYFMQVLGVKKSTVTARAVAGNLSPGSGGACVYTLDPYTDGITIGISINGHPALNAPNCGVADDGNFDTKGGAYSVTAGYVSVSGQIVGKDNVTCTDGQTASECPAGGAPPAADPLAYLTPPIADPPPPPANYPALNTSSIQPGTYNGASFAGNGTFVFPAGTYIFDGGSFTCNGTPTFQGTGVTFYFTNGATWNCTGNDTFQLTAPSSGPYAGILMYQDRNYPSNPSIGGNVGSYFDGALYFPKATVQFFGNTTYSAAMVVAGSISLSGNPTINVTGTSGLPPGVTLVLNSTLVE
ncbi:conserved hypothetical protein [Acidobacteriia bacterium SbA2]|nr:conserved hypothetical protein [Acidobacteriia bacterium SbA2]